MPSALVGATPLHGRQPWPWYGARPSHRSQQGQASRLLLRPLGKTGRIGLHEDDDPRQLARSFARTYQLDAMMRERLQHRLFTATVGHKAVSHAQYLLDDSRDVLRLLETLRNAEG